MTTIANVSKLAGAIVAGAMLLGWSNAEACSLASWSSSTGSPVAGGPTDSTPVRRYSGVCGLRPNPAGNSYVVESTSHLNEGSTTPFRGRFFYYTGQSGSPVIFRATTDDAGTTPAIAITYLDATDNFQFTVNGSSQTTAASSAPANGWVQVEFVYQTGQPFTASTKRMGTATALPAGLTGGAGIERVELGVISGGGGAGASFLDEYEASRAATAGPDNFTRRIRCDANLDNGVSGPDIVLVTSEAAGVSMASGQPDCNQDGGVSGPDIVNVTRIAAGLDPVDAP